MIVDNGPPAADELPAEPTDLRDVVADLAAEVSQLRAENEHLRERVDVDPLQHRQRLVGKFLVAHTLTNTSWYNSCYVG